MKTLSSIQVITLAAFAVATSTYPLYSQDGGRPPTFQLESTAAMVQPFTQLEATVEQQLIAAPLFWYATSQLTPFAAELTTGVRAEALQGAIEFRAFGGIGTGWPLVDPERDDRWDRGAGRSVELFGLQPIGVGEVLNYFAEEYGDQYIATGDPDRDEDQFTNVEYVSAAIVQTGGSIEATVPLSVGRLSGGWDYAWLINATVAGTYWYAAGPIKEPIWSYRFDTGADGWQTVFEALGGIVLVRGKHRFVVAAGYDRADHFGIKHAVRDAGYNYRAPTGDIPALFEWELRPDGRNYRTTLSLQADLNDDVPLPIAIFAVQWVWS